MSQEHMKDFSLLDPIVSSDPFDFYNILHHEAPVYKIPETGTYVITKYTWDQFIWFKYISKNNNYRNEVNPVDKNIIYFMIIHLN